MTTYISANVGRKIVRLVIGCFLLMLFMLGYVFYQSYEGRKDLVTSQRAGCERSKLDRGDNAEGWRTAQKRSLSQGQPGFSAKYDRIASSLEERSKIDCATVFPDAGVLP